LTEFFSRFFKLKDELALILSLPVSFIIVLVIKLEDGGLILYPVRKPRCLQRGIISNGVNGGPEREMVSCLDF